MADVSPYTGRPITEFLDQEIELHDADGDEIGNVVEINPDFLVVQTSTGFLGLGEPRNYFVPRSYVSREEGDDWYLSIDKDQLESMNWGSAPTDSAWAADYSEGAELQATDTDTSYERQGGTRMRRYEEDLDVDKVSRQAGEVSISKRVVEDTKTVEVPVRREEVHVERRPVTGDVAAMSGGEFSGEAFSNETVTVPVMEEDIEIRKVARPVEEIEISKTATEQTERVQDTVRREEFDVDDQTERLR
jgi:uncharacterized protein (TIGR02271 family)